MYEYMYDMYDMYVYVYVCKKAGKNGAKSDTKNRFESYVLPPRTLHYAGEAGLMHACSRDSSPVRKEGRAWNEKGSKFE